MTTGKQKPARFTRKEQRSTGRPPVWRREDLRMFWHAITSALSSVDAATAVGVSGPVGIR